MGSVRIPVSIGVGTAGLDVAMNISGYHNPTLAIALIVISAAFFIYAFIAWKWGDIPRIRFRTPIVWGEDAPAASLLSPDEQGERDFEMGAAIANFKMSPTKEAAVILLTHLREDGVVIRNKSAELLGAPALDAWISEVNGWLREVVRCLKPVSEADSEWFKTLDTVPAARVAIPNVRLGSNYDRDLFQKTFREHDYRLVRLDGLLRKHGVGVD